MLKLKTLIFILIFNLAKMILMLAFLLMALIAFVWFIGRILLQDFIWDL